MTLRDLFAIHALQGLLASAGDLRTIGLTVEELGSTVRLAYDFAEAMLIERKTRKERGDEDAIVTVDMLGRVAITTDGDDYLVVRGDQ